jgi:hypothetical protein
MHAPALMKIMNFEVGGLAAERSKPAAFIRIGRLPTP